MPRIFFTGRRSIPRSKIAITYIAASPPRFSASVDLSQYRGTFPSDARVYVEAYHNTMVQRFDFGTVADCRARGRLELTEFEELDRPKFRVRVVGDDPYPGVLLAARDAVESLEPDDSGAAGGSLLPMKAKNHEEMRGELWRVATISGSYELHYNRDVPSFSNRLLQRDSLVLGAVLPATFREILARELLWTEPGVNEDNEWIRFARSLTADDLPEADEDDTSAIEGWIDGVIQVFCEQLGRFVERLSAEEERAS